MFLTLQGFASSRGHRALAGEDGWGSASVLGDRSPFPLIPDIGEESQEEEIGPPIVLGKGTAKDLKFEWVLTPWSECSEPCGETGFQVKYNDIPII